MTTLHVSLNMIVFLAIMLSYINYRFFKLPPSVAVMAASLIISIVFSSISALGFNHFNIIPQGFVEGLHFRYLLLNFMLGFLLFAGALNIDMSHVKTHKWEIGALATLGTIFATFLVGTVVYFLLVKWFHIAVTYPQSLLFGALIAPTDPIAVVALFKKNNTLPGLANLISAESLYNDGVGVVLFVTLYSICFSHDTATVSSIILLFLQQSVGGMVYGLIIGFIFYYLMASVDDDIVRILLTIALVTGGYTLASYLAVSPLLAMVTAGIVIGNYHRDSLMSAKSRKYLSVFWEIIDELLNAVLFMLIGFEVYVIHASWLIMIVSICVIVIVLLVRYVIVSGLVVAIQPRRRQPYAISILTLGGVRGGLAVALALSIPVAEVRAILLPITYAVVLFSILVQGSLVAPLVNMAVRFNNN